MKPLKNSILGCPIYGNNVEYFLKRFDAILKDPQYTEAEKAYAFTQRLPVEEYLKLKAICTVAEFTNPAIVIKRFIHPEKSVDSYIKEFNAAEQVIGETFENWVSKICRLNTKCNYANFDRAIEKIRVSTINKELRKKKSEGLTISEILKLGMEFEEQEAIINIINKTENIKIETDNGAIKQIEGRRDDKMDRRMVKYDDHNKGSNPQMNYTNRYQWTPRFNNYQGNNYQGSNHQWNNYQGNNYNPRYQNSYYPRQQNFNPRYQNNYRYRNNSNSRFYNRNNFYNNDNRYYNNYNNRFNRHQNESRYTPRYNYDQNNNQSYNNRNQSNNNQLRYSNNVNTVDIEEIKEDNNDKIIKKEHNLFNLGAKNLDEDN
ncbi:GATA zinc finger domain-containing protein 14-like [Gordionus sp. m RMFG-2023]|uniref:GATA zinc finger domain-containing protein 14-like n=1 Tax=Gordionus sp. m RMFG-2023 TaxID=3053472 RepID=UPI0031FBCCBF